MAKKRSRKAKADKIADYIDMASGVLGGYLNERYKIKKTLGEMRQHTLEGLYAFKVAVVRSLVEVILLSTGLIALIVGLLLVVSKVIPWEIMLLGYGVLATSAVLFTMKTRP